MARLADVSPGDLITSQRQNDINDYINDGTEYINTQYLQIGASTVINSTSQLENVDKATITQTSTTGNTLNITRDVTAASTDSPVVNIVQDNTGDDQRVVFIKQDGIGAADTGQALCVHKTSDDFGRTATFEEISQGSSTNVVSLCQGSSRQTMNVYRNLDSTHTGVGVAIINQDHASDDQVALTVSQDAPATSLHVGLTNNGDGGTALVATDTSQGVNTNYVWSAQSGDATRRTLRAARDLDSTHTASPVCAIVNTNTGDDQVALDFKQYSAAMCVRIASYHTDGGGLIARDDSQGTNTNYAWLAHGLDTSRRTGRFIRDIGSTHTGGAVVGIEQKNVSDDQQALYVAQAGSGPGLLVESTNALGYSVSITKNVDAATSGPCYIRQDHITGAVPVLGLDQDDVSEGFINFKGSARGAITGVTNSTQSCRVELNGSVYRLALYPDA